MKKRSLLLLSLLLVNGQQGYGKGPCDYVSEAWDCFTRPFRTFKEVPQEESQENNNQISSPSRQFPLKTLLLSNAGTFFITTVTTAAVTAMTCYYMWGAENSPEPDSPESISTLQNMLGTLNQTYQALLSDWTALQNNATSCQMTLTSADTEYDHLLNQKNLCDVKLATQEKELLTCLFDQETCERHLNQTEEKVNFVTNFSQELANHSFNAQEALLQNVQDKEKLVEASGRLAPHTIQEFGKRLVGHQQKLMDTRNYCFSHLQNIKNVLFTPEFKTQIMKFCLVWIYQQALEDLSTPYVIGARSIAEEYDVIQGGLQRSFNLTGQGRRDYQNYYLG